MDYIMAIEYSECDSKTQKLCLSKHQNGDCKKSLFNCHYPMKINPLCMNKRINDCNRNWRIEEHKGKIYIFYSCNKRCKYFITDFDSAIKSILEPMKSEDIYWGKDLKKLSKDIFKTDKPTTDFERTVKFFEDAFKSLNTKCTSE